LYEAVAAGPQRGPATTGINGLVPLETRARGQNERREKRVAESPVAKPQHAFLLVEMGDPCARKKPRNEVSR
jgi:hypothetical protein